MAFRNPQEIAELTIENGTKKANMTFMNMILLGFLGGAFISVGFLLDIRVTAGMPPAMWGSFISFLGAAVFPIGLVLVLLAGGELVTGNMMTLAMALFSRKIGISKLINNWIIITITNFIGAMCVAYFFGHVVGLTEGAPFLDKTISIASGKLDETFLQAFISAIGCNWLVCLAVWMSYGAKDMIGKMIAIWFPVMAFVAIGFQHVVANMFVIPAAIFAGKFTWIDYLNNFVPVFLGNIVGGAIFVAGIYWLTYLRKVQK